jgi:protein TonB
MNELPLSQFEDHDPHDRARWGTAAAIVAVLYVGAVAFAWSWHDQPQEIGDESDIVTVELTPIDATPDAVARDAAPAPETMIEAKPLPQPEAQKQKDEVKPEPPPDASAILPESAVKPPEKAEEVRPAAPRTAEQVKGGAPHIEPSWQTNLVRQLQRYKRYPSEAQARSEQGVVLLGFSLDRSGHVLAHRIVQSSGYPDLDDEVMAMIMRAEPLPAFPASMPQARIDLTVPIRFSIK